MPPVFLIEVFDSNPLYSVASLPAPILLFLFGIVVYTDATLLPIVPLAFVFASVRPSKDTVALFFVIEVVADVGAPISPLEGALAVHFIVFPASVVLAAIDPLVQTLTMDIIVLEFTVVLAAIRPTELTHSAFLSVFILTFKISPIGPRFSSLPTLLVLDPFANVPGAISVRVFAIAMSLIILPRSLIPVTFSMNEPASSISTVAGKETLVYTAVNPDQLSFSMFLVSLLIPLTCVDAPIRQSLFISLGLREIVWVWPVLKFR